MLFYGDQSRTEPARAKLAGIVRAVRRAEAMAGGVARHAALVSAFIEAGEFVQGVADVEFAARGGRDGRSAAVDLAIALLTRIAASIRSSWNSGFARGEAVPPELFRAAALSDLPETLRVKRAEGFAFYAVYPEAYLAAAQAAAPVLGRATKVIGIRSIGAALAALVAAGTGAAAPLTLRPVGHPFRRQLSMAEALQQEILADRDAAYAVADEGPGLSGSSFGGVADFLEDRGVPAGRIHFFPSHAGDPGPRASPRHRERWARAARHVVEFDDLVLRAPALPEHRLSLWAADLTGTSEGRLEDVSGGAWRRFRYAGEEDWPPVDARSERRKFLLHGPGGAWLLKFAGLGPEGERKLERARALHAAGFCPRVAGLRHGFLVAEWIAGARPLDGGEWGADRLAAHVGRYLGFRARRFPAGGERGASPEALRRMARHNTAEALGEEWARRVERRTAGLDAMGRRLRPVETDGRLHPWEWLVLPDGGGLLKTDALDHHAGHDLIGCQDVAWDIVGAVVELGLRGHVAQLCQAIEREAGYAVEPASLALMEPCYLAFHLGACAMAAQVAAPNEAKRLDSAVGRYAGLLRSVLADGDPGRGPISAQGCGTN